MHLQAIISGVVLLLTGPVDSFLKVNGVVGHTVTLPCTYPVASGISSLCWDYGACASNICRRELIWSDQPRVYNRLNKRYRLMGQILLGNVSLTIENATESDSGLFCCKLWIKRRSDVQRLTISLKVQPEIPTSPPSRLTMITTSATTSTKPTTTTKSTTTSTRLTDVPKSTRISSSTLPTPADTLTPKPDWNSTVTSTDYPWDNHTEAFPTGELLKGTTKISYIGISIAILLLLLLASVLIFTKYYHVKKKTGSLSLINHISKIRALQNTVVLRPRGEDAVYIIEDSLHVKE